MFFPIEATVSYWPYAAYLSLGIFFCIQLYYILFVYSKLAAHRITESANEQTLPPVSVIISAYNEYDNLKKFLPLILQQSYPTFEVVVVNDCSDDETQWLLREMASTYAHLKIVDIGEHIRLKHTKKFTLTIGIKAAKYEHLVFTDADCEPATTQWLHLMVAPFAEDKEIILGYSPYFKHRGLLNKLIRFETTHTAMNYLSYALKGDAYMGVGRNLAYTKSLFYKGKGFNAHMHIKSGDDDLFVNQNSNATNTTIAISPQAHMYSIPKLTWKSYYKQKARHAGASVMYKSRHKWMLATQLVSALFFYASLGVSAALLPHMWYVPLAVYLLRLLAQYTVYGYVFRKLAVRDLLLWLPVLDLLFYFFICLNGLFNRNRKQTSWK
ncbi:MULTISPECIES: glycosyltransferase [Sphingobacterium]|uniref:Glycosyltransferase n=1 Tax=Sphingobacterium populi TaxID=1812824 RepID=A0ABW5UCE4_9SPHI|nr:glycosyltransferase [Sphingobacterium sp. CFCC 11742]